ncbi:MAG: hypothetical protein RLY45_997 [Actinomycetota bacterium]
MAALWICGIVGCGSDSDATTSQPSQNTGGDIGLPAPEATEDAPFQLTVTPETTEAGAAVTLSVVGDLSGDWLGGPDVTFDRNIEGAWRSMWMVIDSSAGDLPFELGADKPTPTIPALGLAPDTPLSVATPDSADAGTYRVCRGFIDPKLRSIYLCAPVTLT